MISDDHMSSAASYLLLPELRTDEEVMLMEERKVVYRSQSSQSLNVISFHCHRRDPKHRIRDMGTEWLYLSTFQYILSQL